MADTRKDKRAPVSLKVRFKSATVDEFIEHYSKDVSRGGIYIKSGNPMAVGTLLKFQFQLKDESALIKGVGRVVWTRAEVDATADAPAGMGIKFIKMDDESRMMVERILDANDSDPGSYVSGRLNATSSEPISSAPPSSSTGGGNFFPDLPPAVLPPPEDRTAVRHATQFLAEALKEGNDEAAAAEAAVKAEEAKKRQAEVEAQRKAEAEAKKKDESAQQGAGDNSSLPSMIVDPSLEPRAGRPSEAERVMEDTPVPRPQVAFGHVDADDSSEPDTEPPPAGPEDLKAPTTSIPDSSAQPRRSMLPMVAIALVVVVAAWVALRGGPTENAIEQGPVAEPIEPTPAAIAPAPAPEQVPEPAATADAAAVAVEEKPSAAVEVEKVSVEVVATPREAEIFVGGEKKGEGSLSVDLPAGVASTLSARAKGYLEATQTLTPTTGKKQSTIKLKLKPIPYIVHVETTPAGAAINVAGVKGTSPADLTLDKPPTQELSVTVKLDGYERALTRIPPTAFIESDSAMRAQLALTLQAKVAAEPSKEASPAEPAPKHHKRAAPKAAPVAAKPAEASEPAPEATAAEPAPAPEEPKPEPAKEEPKPSEPLPGNPFGN